MLKLYPRKLKNTKERKSFKTVLKNRTGSRSLKMNKRIDNMN